MKVVKLLSFVFVFVIFSLIAKDCQAVSSTSEAEEKNYRIYYTGYLGGVNRRIEYVTIPDEQVYIPFVEDGWNRRNPVVSPDMTKLAFARYDSQDSDYTVCLSGLDGQDEAVLYSTVFSIGSIEWHPSGNSLIVVIKNHSSNDNRDGTVYLIDVASGATVPLTAENDWTYQKHHAAASPDGTRICFNRNANSFYAWPQDLWIMNIDGSQLLKITNYGSGDGNKVWRCLFTPDGSSVLHSKGDGTVRMVDLDGSNNIVVPELNGDSFSAKYSSDGQYIVFVRRIGTTFHPAYLDLTLRTISTISSISLVSVLDYPDMILLSQPSTTHTVILHPGAHGRIVEANSGSDYVAEFEDGEAFPSVNVTPDEGYEFVGFSPELPETITGDFEATAQYVYTELANAVDIPLDFDNWFVKFDGDSEMISEGIKFNGCGYRRGNELFSKQLYDFRNSHTFMKFRLSGGGSYSRFFVYLYNVAVHRTMSTEYSYESSRTVSADTWYYVHHYVDGDGNYTSVTSTDDYDVSGGSILDTKTGNMAQDRNDPYLSSLVEHGQLAFEFDDTYGGTSAYIVASEAKTTAQQASYYVSQVYSFDDGTIPEIFNTTSGVQIVEDDRGGKCLFIPDDQQEFVTVDAPGVIAAGQQIKGDYWGSGLGSSRLNTGSNGKVYHTLGQNDGQIDNWTDQYVLSVPEVSEGGSFGWFALPGSDGGNGTYLDDIVLYSTKPLSYTVTFDAGDNCFVVEGSSPIIQTVIYGSEAIAPDMEAYEGYYFMGWDKDFSSVTSDLTVHAVSRERFNGKDGIEEPLEVLIADELMYISENSEYWNKDVALTGNIDCEGLYLLPIGSLDIPFSGEFNGCGYTISNLGLGFCDTPVQGLFGIIGIDGVVENLGVEADITATRYLNFDSGIIAGQNQGVISCCRSYGNVAGYITAGGIAGYNVGTISNCYSFADCRAYFAAGLIGENIGDVQNCYTATTIASIDNGTSDSCLILDAAVPSVLETFGWDTVNNNEDGKMDCWFQYEQQLPLLFWEAEPGDANYDGTVNLDNMAVMIGWWLENEENLPANVRLQNDYNFDGIVNLEDMIVVVRAMNNPDM